MQVIKLSILRPRLAQQLLALLASVAIATGLVAPALGAVDCMTAPNSACGTITGTITTTSTATYRVWSRIKVPDATNNSFWLQVDSAAPIVIGDSASITPNQWVWVNYKLGQPTALVDIILSAGSHTVVLTGRETGAEVDRVIFTADTSNAACSPPKGTGNDCANTGVATGPGITYPTPDSGSSPNPTTPTTAGSPSAPGSSALVTAAATSTKSTFSLAGQKLVVAPGTVRVLGYAGGIGLVLLVAILAWWFLHQRMLAHFRRQLVSGSPATSSHRTSSRLPHDAPPDTPAP